MKMIQTSPLRTSSRSHVAVACLLAITSVFGFADRAGGQDRVGQIGSLLQAAHARGQFNGTALVAERGQILYSHAFGYADLDQRTPLQVSSTFELASISKPFTALSVMILQQRGRLSYDDLVTKYIPELPYEGITIRHLLTHTSGLPESEPLFGGDWPRQKVATNSDLVGRLVKLKPGVYFKAGEKWRYNPTGYFLLARIIEIISGASFDEFLQQNVFGPAGMRNSSVFNHLVHHGKTNLALGYMRRGALSNDFALPETMSRYRYIVKFGDTSGAIGVHSSVEDLFHWMDALTSGRLLPVKTLSEAFVPARLTDGRIPSAGATPDGLPLQYGFGWFIQTGPNGKTIRHSGDWPGYITCLIHNLDKRQTVVVLSNQGDPAAVEIAATLEQMLNGKAGVLPRMSIARELGRTISSGGVAGAIARYHELRKSRPEDFNFSDLGELNGLGYEFLRLGSKSEAVQVFKLNAQIFPDSWVAHDSLGEACIAVGDRDQAMRSYRRSVELNPQNTAGPRGVDEAANSQRFAPLISSAPTSGKQWSPE